METTARDNAQSLYSELANALDMTTKSTAYCHLFCKGCFSGCGFVLLVRAAAFTSCHSIQE